MSVLIRPYTPAYCQEISELFYQTVHSVNAADYTEEQLKVWAAGKVDLEQWNRSFLSHTTFVAFWESQLAGFGDIDETGYLDRLYVHKDHQRRGIAAALCDRLEEAAFLQGADRIVTHASITAKPFFLKRGYRLVKEQQVERQGVWLTNFVMEKD